MFGVAPRVLRRFASSGVRLGLVWLAGVAASHGIDVFGGDTEAAELAEEIVDWMLAIGLPAVVLWWSARRAKRTEETIEAARWSNPGSPRALIDAAVKRGDFRVEERSSASTIARE